MDTVDNGLFSIREMGDGSETLSIDQQPCDIDQSPSTNQNEVTNLNSGNQSREANHTDEAQLPKEKPPNIRVKRENSFSR